MIETLETPNEPNFAVGREAPRRHREYGDVSKWNLNKELGLMLCGLRVSVVKNRGRARYWGLEIADWGFAFARARDVKRTQLARASAGPGNSKS